MEETLTIKKRGDKMGFRALFQTIIQGACIGDQETRKAKEKRLKFQKFRELLHGSW